jgi:hypothetical protein
MTNYSTIRPFWMANSPIQMQSLCWSTTVTSLRAQYFDLVQQVNLKDEKVRHLTCNFSWKAVYQGTKELHGVCKSPISETSFWRFLSAR